MRILLTSFAAIALGFSLVTPATAQWTFDPGYVPGVMGPVVTDPCTGGRCGLETSSSHAGNQSFGLTITQSLTGDLPQATERDIKLLGFRSSQQRRNANIETFIARTPSAHRADAARLRTINEGGQVFAAMDQALGKHGLSTSNLADAYTTWWMMAYNGAHGISGDPTTQQVLGVRRQATAALMAVPGIGSMDDAAKQEMADALLIQAFLVASLIHDAEQNPSLWPQVKNAVAAGARASGLDVQSMQMTSTGFALR